MPELPDLEVFKSNIFDRLSSKRLVGPEVFNPQKVRAPAAILAQELAGLDLLRIERLGKELLFDFGGHRVVAAHLMLNGEIAIVPQEAVGAIRFKIFALHFANESVVFSDRGALCTIRYRPPADRAPDAFAPAFTWEYFLRAARGRPGMNVKAFLIDQKIIKGIGNAYADEILWAARVSPHSLLGKIPEDRLRALYDAIGVVLHDAIASIKQIAPDIITGEERGFLKVHNKALKKTETGYPITVERIASKITYYSGEQVLYS
ncbi:MAG: hypothetical protein FWE98_02750 [Oscillospiraceae bacterium]|nr:hypothetical protein [Oscillospiraceae bacterium]